MPASPPPVPYWRTGSGVPSNSLGINNDFYLDSAADNLYQKQAGAYVLVASFGGSGGSEPDNQIVYGTGSGMDSSENLTYDHVGVEGTRALTTYQNPSNTSGGPLDGNAAVVVDVLSENSSDGSFASVLLKSAIADSLNQYNYHVYAVTDFTNVGDVSGSLDPVFSVNTYGVVEVGGMNGHPESGSQVIYGGYYARMGTFFASPGNEGTIDAFAMHVTSSGFDNFAAVACLEVTDQFGQAPQDWDLIIRNANASINLGKGDRLLSAAGIAFWTEGGFDDDGFTFNRAYFGSKTSPRSNANVSIVSELADSAAWFSMLNMTLNTANYGSDPDGSGNNQYFIHCNLFPNFDTGLVTPFSVDLIGNTIARTYASPAVTVDDLATINPGGLPCRAFVSDSTVAASGNFGEIVAGGGGNLVPVYYDLSDWRIG